MKIAFLCLTHNNLQYLSILSEYYCSDNDDLFIHLDSNVENDYKGEFNPRVNWVEDDKRKRTRWGTFEIVEATIELMKIATKKGIYDRYILISGSDIPLVDKQTLKERINNKFEYVSVWNMIEKNNVKNSTLYNEFFRYNNNNILNYGECRANKFKLYSFLILKKILYKMPFKFSGKFERYAKGSQWWCVSHTLCIEFLEAFNNGIGTEFKYMHAPDEKFFHTVALNSKKLGQNLKSKKSIESCIHGIHYIDWKGDLNPQLEFSFVDIEKAMGSGALFARKIKNKDISLFQKFVINRLMK